MPDESDDPIAPVDATEASTRPGERITWESCQSVPDWVDPETGECLTGYEPEETFRRLVAGHDTRDLLPSVRMKASSRYTIPFLHTAWVGSHPTAV